MNEQKKVDEDENLNSRASTRIYKGELYSISDIRGIDENRNKQVFSDRGLNSEAVNNINKSTKMQNIQKKIESSSHTAVNENFEENK